MMCRITSKLVNFQFMTCMQKRLKLIEVLNDGAIFKTTLRTLNHNLNGNSKLCAPSVVDVSSIQ